MPLYEYKCESCGVEFERLIRNGQKQEIACSECGSKNITRLISLFASAASSSTSQGSACGTCSASSCQSCG